MWTRTEGERRCACRSANRLLKTDSAIDEPWRGNVEGAEVLRKLADGLAASRAAAER